MAKRNANNKSQTRRTPVKRISQEESFRHGDEAAAYFARIRWRLYKRPEYRGKHVAIRDKKVVDVDGDKIVLYHRLLERFPDHRFIVMPVWAEFPAIAFTMFGSPYYVSRIHD